MRKIISVCAFVLILSTLRAQDCTGSINAGVSSVGLHPSVLPNATVGVPYDEIITLVLPRSIDNTLTPPPGDSIIQCAEGIVQWINLPAGFTVEVWAFHAPGSPYDVLAQPTDTIHIYPNTSITRACIRIKNLNPSAPVDMNDCLTAIDSNHIGLELETWADLFGCSSLGSAARDTVYATLVLEEAPGTWDACDSAQVNNPGMYCSDVSFNICNGDTLLVGANSYTISGDYVDIFPSSSGCDSTVKIHLQVDPPINVYFTDSICPGDTIVINSIEYTSPGNYQQVLTSVNGCDSTNHYNVYAAGCVGIEENSTPEFLIFPNPVNDRVNIQLISNHVIREISLVNSLGMVQMIQQVYLSNGDNYSMDISILPPGLYILWLDNYPTKLIKK